MRIKIAENFWQRYVQSQYGKTQSVKESMAENIWDMPGKSWARTMLNHKGQWVEVDCEYLFEESFNAINNQDKSGFRVDRRYIEAINFKPEFKNIDEFEIAVQKRYDKDWPGRKIQPIIRRSIKLGLINEINL